MPSNLLQAGTPAPEFTLHSTPDQTRVAERVPRPAGRSSPSIPPTGVPSAATRWRSTTRCCPSFASTARRSSASRSTASGVTRRSPQRPQAAFPAARRLRAQGRGGAAVRRLSRSTTARRERALFVIDGEGIIRWSYSRRSGVNPGADGILEALDALTAEAGSEPGRERQHRSSRRSGRTDHAPGPGRRAGDARRVWRLRVSLLRPGVSDREGASSSALGEPAALRLPELSARPNRTRTPSTRPRRRRRPAPRGGSGRCTMCSTSIRMRSAIATSSAMPTELGLDADRVARELRERGRASDKVRCGFPRRRAQRRQRHAHLLHQRRALRRLVAGRGGFRACAHRGAGHDCGPPALNACGPLAC